MRILLEVEKDKLQALTNLAKKSHVSRASLLRKAIDNFLEASPPQQKNRKAFGLLKNRPNLEGLDFQKKLRSEWDK